MNKLTSALLFCAISLTSIHAQQSLNASGSIAIGTNGTAAYSIGQLVTEIVPGIEGSVATGVQQAYEISEIIEGPDYNRVAFEGITLTVSATLSPTTDYLQLNVLGLNISNVSFQLYSVQGKLLKSQPITQAHTQIDMRPLMPLVYFVKVKQGNAFVKTFKVVRN